MSHRHGHGHDHAQHHRDVFGNPQDLAEYLRKLEDPSRDAWQKPDEVLRALGVKPGQTIADIGGGPGYFSLRLARAVGERGVVYASEAEPKMLEVLRERLGAAKVTNVVPVLALGDDPLVPRGSCDLVLVVDTHHHFADPVAYLQKLKTLLKPGGRFANIDFHPTELPVGPPVDHKVSREDFLGAAERAGFRVVEEHAFLPYQYFLVLEPR